MPVRRKGPPAPPIPPPVPAQKKAKRTNLKHGNTTEMRERFVLEYLVDQNGTQAAIRAGASPHSAHATASRWLKRVDIRERIEAHRESVLQPLRDRYEITTDKIMRELALLAFSNPADYMRVDDEGQAVIDLSDATRDQFAAIHSVKAKTSTRYMGDVEIVERATELRLVSKRDALVDLARIHGLFKEEGGVQVPVRFIIQWGPGPRPEPYPDEIEGEAA